MRFSIKHVRPSTVLFAAALVILGGVLVIEERKAARLHAALAYYKSLSHERVADRLRGKALLQWADDCPLGEVVEQIKQTTAAPSKRGWPVFPLGVPIKVDPIGLERAGRSLQSPVPSPPADVQLTLGEKLQAVLEPLGLACDVRDASLVITARDLVISPIKLSDQEDE
jgi:hypothetical protein